MYNVDPYACTCIICVRTLVTTKALISIINHFFNPSLVVRNTDMNTHKTKKITSVDKTGKHIYPITAKDSKVYNVVDKGKLKITKVAIDS